MLETKKQTRNRGLPVADPVLTAATPAANLPTSCSTGGTIVFWILELPGDFIPDVGVLKVFRDGSFWLFIAEAKFALLSLNYTEYS